ncbi:MAG: FHA domain-containing protein [Planctomycetes bacterium]|nr:FHA domain-containing protein [Planctomycetota bacterium]
MDVILKVLDGAKVGAKVAVKKDRFLIGRSSKCHLCAGSTAVSRKHCAISRDGTKVSIKDLGSRNGTLVNDEKIAGEVGLSSGDEITVGPLRFLLTITPGINNEKRPQVKSVADAVERTVESGDLDIEDDDISRWLIDEPKQPSQAATETQTLSMDETNAIHAKLASGEELGEPSNLLTPEPVSADEEISDSEAKSKKKPGKLPPVATGPSTKDSRDAAAAALRNWNRRS